MLEACTPKALGVSRPYKYDFFEMGTVECVEIDDGGLCNGGWMALSGLGPLGRDPEGYFSNGLKRDQIQNIKSSLRRLEDPESRY